ncbi:MAG: hypothetical protein WBP46_02445 [Thiolinea sp.]
MQVGLEGRIHIVLNLATRSASVQIQRPLAAIQKLLVGKTVEQVLEHIPLLFSICSYAQSLAALNACQQALGIAMNKELQTAQQELVNLETQREHVLRILMDWNEQAPNPALVQQAMRVLPQAKASWFKAGQAFSLDSEVAIIDTDILDAWDAFLDTHIFAMPVDEWSRLNTLQALQAWIDAQATLPAQALAQLQQQHLASLGANAFPLAQEASVLKRQAQQPVIQASLTRYGNGVFTRHLARLVELANAPSWQNDWVEAARGELQHEVTLNADQAIETYKILAPTDVNFAASGIAAAGLQTLLQTTQNSMQLDHYARLWIAAIDPCVAYELELQHA